MLTKYDLRNYLKAQRQIEQLQEQIQELELTCIVPGSQKLTGMPRSESPNHDKIGAVVAKIEELKAYYLEKLEGLIELQQRIEKAIDVLDYDEQMLIRLRYFQGYKWDIIAGKMCSGAWATVHRIHRRALNKLAQIE